jgi:hypothetical protein
VFDCYRNYLLTVLDNELIDDLVLVVPYVSVGTSATLISCVPVNVELVAFDVLGAAYGTTVKH